MNQVLISSLLLIRNNLLRTSCSGLTHLRSESQDLAGQTLEFLLANSKLDSLEVDELILPSPWEPFSIVHNVPQN